MRGNVVDLAVGVIIGAAFGKIVSSIVNDIIMPPIGLASWARWISPTIPLAGKLRMREALPQRPPDGKDRPSPGWRYWDFSEHHHAEFTIVAFCVFLLVKGMNALITKEAAAPTAPPPTEKLLTEIRDLLKNRP